MNQDTFYFAFPSSFCLEAFYYSILPKLVNMPDSGLYDPGSGKADLALYLF
jgi:hypothetical protein